MNMNISMRYFYGVTVPQAELSSTELKKLPYSKNDYYTYDTSTT